MAAKYFTIFTTIGLARLAAAQVSGTPLVFTHVAIGDGGGSPITPNPSMTGLVAERARFPVNSISLAPDAANTVRVEALIPAGSGGFTVREAGIFSAANELIAIASYPPVALPLPGDGAWVQGYVRLLLVYAVVSAIAITIDGSVITATRFDLDDATAGDLALWQAFS